MQSNQVLSAQFSVLRMMRLLILLGTSHFALSTSSSFAEQPLEVKLVSEVQSIQPGKPFHVGLHLHHGPHYHSYWRFAGIVGVPTSIAWKLPPGFTAGDIEWPEPEQVLMFQIKAQGFERDVLLPVKITPPADLKPGQTIRLEGRASWMACARTCHPGFTDVSIDLPVTAEPPKPDEKWQPLFNKERALQPQSSEAWTAAVVEKGPVVSLKLTPSDDTARELMEQDDTAKIIFFTDDGWIDSDKPQAVVVNADGTLIITLQRSDVYLGKKPPTHLRGVVQRPGGWVEGQTWRSLQIAPMISR